MSDREDLVEEKTKDAWSEDTDADAPPAEQDAPPAVKGRKSANDAAGKRPKFDFSASRQFVSWMDEQNLSLGFTTYQAGKLFLIGRRSRGRLSMFQRSFGRLHFLTLFQKCGDFRTVGGRLDRQRMFCGHRHVSHTHQRIRARGIN